MAQGREEFVRQLAELGYTVECRAENRVVFTHIVGEGRFAGRAVQVGVEVPPDFPRTPPPGPHFSPLLLPINEGAAQHPEKVLKSNFGEQFGGEWEYWSRPCKTWKGKEPVAKYIEFLEMLLRTA